MNETVPFEQVLDEYGAFVWTNVGTSMLPLIHEGQDILTINKKNGKLKELDIVLYIRLYSSKETQYILHRIIKDNKDGTYLLVGDNCTYSEIISEDRIIGVLTQIKRNGRSVNLSSPLMKLYNNIWCRPYKLRIFLLKIYRNYFLRIIRKLKRIIIVKTSD